MAKKITKHGIRWINDDCGLYCSECNTSNINWEISAYQPRFSDTITWTAKCRCNLCHCEWEISRDEIVREND